MLQQKLKMEFTKSRSLREWRKKTGSEFTATLQ
jgi:hypothetical protein